MRTIGLRGLKDNEYAALKEDIKRLPFKATVRQWKRKYAYGAIDIRPVKANDYSFSKDEIDAVLAVMSRHGLRTDSEQYQETVPHYDLIYRSGLNFVYKIA